MFITEIKATVPGAGKTETLVRTCVKLLNSSKVKLVVLSPSNKNKQNIIQKFQSYGITDSYRFVKTFREFKSNFTRAKMSKRHFDMETMDYIYTDEYGPYITTESKFHYKKVWDYVFIDEAGMISDLEMKDLVKHWKIKHLVLCGDSNQFAPIPSYYELEGTHVSKWDDDGSFYDLPIDYQILLNKSMRAKDEKLERAIQLVKNGDLIDALLMFENNDRIELKKGDYNIAYTNAACKRINRQYLERGRVDKYIVVDNDKKHRFSNSEILSKDDRRFDQLKNDLAVEDWLSWDEWQTLYLRPAMCVTAHKLQGTTIPEGRIYIHLDDVISGVYENENIKPEDKITTVQKFLYIALSRACNFDQIRLLWHGDCILELFIGNARGIEKVAESVEKLLNIDNEMKPMVDESIFSQPSWVGAADVQYGDENEVVRQLLMILNQETEALELEGEREYLRDYRNSRRKKYTDFEVDFALTHSFRECKEKFGWSKEKTGNIRKYSRVMQVKSDSNKKFHYTHMELNNSIIFNLSGSAEGLGGREVDGKRRQKRVQTAGF